jgi:hypothetical protein
MAMVTVSALFASGCATTVPLNPDFMDAGLSPAKIDKITVLPAVDLRKERSIAISREMLHEMMIVWGLMPSRLERIGYPEIDYLPVSAAAAIAADDIAEARPQWIGKLGLPSDRWILLVTLDDFVSAEAYGMALSAKCSGYLFSKDAGKIAWRHRIAVEGSAPGLIGMLFEINFKKGSMEFHMLRRCARELIEQFPARVAKN